MADLEQTIKVAIIVKPDCRKLAEGIVKLLIRVDAVKRSKAVPLIIDVVEGEIRQQLGLEDE
jgi:hypothetical protein